MFATGETVGPAEWIIKICILYARVLDKHHLEILIDPHKIWDNK